MKVRSIDAQFYVCSRKSVTHNTNIRKTAKHSSKTQQQQLQTKKIIIRQLLNAASGDISIA